MLTEYYYNVYNIIILLSYNTVEISRLVNRSYDQRVERRFNENRHRNYCIILYYKRVLYYIVLQTTMTIKL